MPNQPKTPMHTIRIDADLWTAFGVAANDRTAVLREFIRWYVRDPGAKAPRRPDLVQSASADHVAGSSR